MICEQCGGEMEKGKPWEFKGKTFNREVCSQCGWKAKAFLVRGGEETPKKDRDYDRENRGKVRMNLAKIAYEQNKVLNKALVTEIEVWVDYVMTGKLE